MPTISFWSCIVLSALSLISPFDISDTSMENSTDTESMRPSGLTLRLINICAEPFEPLRVRLFVAGGSCDGSAETIDSFDLPLSGWGAWTCSPFGHGATAKMCLQRQVVSALCSSKSGHVQIQ